VSTPRRPAMPPLAGMTAASSAAEEPMILGGVGATNTARSVRTQPAALGSTVEQSQPTSSLVVRRAFPARYS